MTLSDLALQNTVLNFWFKETPKEFWFAKNQAFDAQIRDSFLHFYQEAKKGTYDQWSSSPEGTLALIITFDQFPRNMFRNDPQTYATDKKALQLAKLALKKRYADHFSDPDKLHFLFLPFMHSENREDQERCVALFQNSPETLVWAKHHRDIIKQFERFPHRNAVLGRLSTPLEDIYLKSPLNRF